jgi:uncharacterized protein YfaS (alpha-2-macroglobulin family)
MPLPAKLPGFIFGDLADDKAKNRQDLEEQELDADGKASVAIGLRRAQSPMNPRGLQPAGAGGRPVVRTLERAWWPAPVLVGARPLFDRNVAPEAAGRVRAGPRGRGRQLQAGQGGAAQAHLRGAPVVLAL